MDVVTAPPENGGYGTNITRHNTAWRQRQLTGDSFQETLQLLAANGMLKLTNRFGFNLPHAFTGDLEDPADLFQGVGVAVTEPVPEANDFSFAIGQRLEQVVNLGAEHHSGRFGHGAARAVVFDEFTETAVFALAHGAIETDRLPANVQHPAGFFNADVSGRGGLSPGRSGEKAAASAAANLSSACGSSRAGASGTGSGRGRGGFDLAVGARDPRRRRRWARRIRGARRGSRRSAAARSAAGSSQWRHTVMSRYGPDPVRLPWVSVDPGEEVMLAPKAFELDRRVRFLAACGGEHRARRRRARPARRLGGRRRRSAPGDQQQGSAQDGRPSRTTPTCPTTPAPGTRGTTPASRT